MRHKITILVTAFCLITLQSCHGNGSGPTTTQQDSKAGGTTSTGSGSNSSGDGTGNTTGGVTGVTGASPNPEQRGSSAGTAAGSNTTNQQHQPSRNP